MVATTVASRRARSRTATAKSRTATARSRTASARSRTATAKSRLPVKCALPPLWPGHRRLSPALSARRRRHRETPRHREPPGRAQTARRPLLRAGGGPHQILGGGDDRVGVDAVCVYELLGRAGAGHLGDRELADADAFD